MARADSAVAKLEPLLVYGPSQLISSLLRCIGGEFIEYCLATDLLGLAPILPALLLFMWVLRVWCQIVWLAEARSQMTAQPLKALLPSGDSAKCCRTTI